MSSAPSAQLFIGAVLGSALLAGDATWIKFLSGAGAILLTFLAGAELDPVVFRKQRLMVRQDYRFVIFFVIAASVSPLYNRKPVQTGAQFNP